MSAFRISGFRMSATGAPGITSGEALRKLLHIGVGFGALLLRWLTWPQALAVCAAAVVMNWLVLPRATHHSMERPEEKRRGFAAGIVLYPIAVGLLCLLFGTRLEIVAAAWAILAFGDGCATLAGRLLGGPRLPWCPYKSWAGLLAFVGAGGLSASLMSLWVKPDQDTLTVVWSCYAAALVAALVESLPTGINDNLSVPLMSGGFLFALTFTSMELATQRAGSLRQRLVAALLVNAVVAAAAVAARAVKGSGVVAGFLVGVTIYLFGGWQSYVVLLLFFVLGTAATKVGYERKAARRIAQEEGGRRGARHAVANCGVAAFAAFLAYASPWSDLFMVALVAAFATAVFDTVSSEIGQVYGRRTFLITTLRPVPPGTDGAVSLEGTLAGLAASVALSGAALWMGMMGGLGWQGAALAVAGAFVGTTVESYLGATVEALDLIDNEAMNFTNTLVGALAAMGLCVLVIS